MTPAGHLACAWLAARRGGTDLRRLGAIALGALSPDLVDKALQVAGATPHGRTVGHSFFVWGFAILLWCAGLALRLPRARVLGWIVLGALTHVVADGIDDVVEGLEHTGYVLSPWFGWPYANPDQWNVPVPRLLPELPHRPTTLELATVALAGWRARRDARLQR